VNDSIFVSTKCPSDTVRVEKVIQTIVNETKKETNWLPVVIAIVATTIVFFVFTIFMKLK
jgi:phosphotransferase system  glucose/maltose/N-acetylglucosamine-specific IIC component